MLIAHSMNMKTPSVVAMVLLLNISRDNNGCSAPKGGHSQRCSPHIAKESVATHFHVHSQITRIYL